MAVFHQQVDDGCQFSVRPNCALTWRSTKRLFLGFGFCLAGVGCYFVSQGAWMVLPFAGLELVALGAGLYFSALSGHTREVVEISGAQLHILRGRRRLEEVASMPRYWTRVVLSRDPSGWYPSRLFLRCHGRRVEVGAKLIEAEREQLADQLADKLGPPRRGAFTETPGLVVPDRGRHAVNGVGGLLDAEVHAMTSVHPARSAMGRETTTRCASGAYSER
jgi:uncharacterized membrane protein